MKIFWSETERGLRRGTFKDLYAADCSIQESAENAIWLGRETTDQAGERRCPRMHLTRDMALSLALTLIVFAQTGLLEEPIGDPADAAL